MSFDTVAIDRQHLSWKQEKFMVDTRRGVPQRLLSDRVPVFALELIRELARLLGLKKIYTSPYHPQGTGSNPPCVRPARWRWRAIVPMIKACGSWRPPCFRAA
eukprot:Polyplicarium_translucidae@DN1662_c0_g1_i2.p6